MLCRHQAAQETPVVVVVAMHADSQQRKAASLPLWALLPSCVGSRGKPLAASILVKWFLPGSGAHSFPCADHGHFSIIDRFGAEGAVVGPDGMNIGSFFSEMIIAIYCT